MHIFVDASCAGDTRPSAAQSSPRLDELTFEDEHKLWKLMGVNREPCSWLESNDPHLPAICLRDVLHEHTRSERRRPPREVRRVRTRQGTAFKPAHRLRLAVQRSDSAAGMRAARAPGPLQCEVRRRIRYHSRKWRRRNVSIFCTSSRYCVELVKMSLCRPPS